ncbi:hypothetical protein L208DRAFT_1336319, partial [Tricholoma matsutake]
PLLGAPPIPVLCSIILTSDFPLLEAEVALIWLAMLHIPNDELSVQLHHELLAPHSPNVAYLPPCRLQLA